jgi:hypothetical protein
MAHSQPKITFEQARAAISFPFENIVAVIKLGLFPFLLSIVAITAVFILFAPNMADLQGPDALERFAGAFVPIQILSQLIIIVFASIFAVGIHRHIVLGQPASWIFFRFRKYELFYILTTIVIFGIMLALFLAVFFLLPAFAPALAPGPEGGIPIAVTLIFVAVWVIYIWLYVKLILALPNAAVTGRISLARSWNALRGNFWRFIGYSLVILLSYFVPILLLSLIATGLLQAQSGAFVAVVLNLVIMVISIFLGVSFLAYLSYVYRQLVAQPAQEAWAQNGGTT